MAHLEAGVRDSRSSDQHAPRILIVENQAHVREGHFPIMFAELARALHAEGCEVTVLTSRGWALEDAASPQPFTIARLSRFALSVYLRGKLFDRWPPRHERWLSTIVRDTIMAMSVRNSRRQLGGADLIMTSISSDPWIWTLLAGPGRSLIYQFSSPKNEPPRALSSAAKWAEGHRRRNGDRTRIAVNHNDARVRYCQMASWFEPVQLPFIASWAVEPRSDARRRLDLEPDTPLALLFGSFEGVKKDHEVVWRAFQSLPEWRLAIAGGGAADAYQRWRSRQEDIEYKPVLYEGFASDDLRQLLHSAADLVVLSFRPGSRLDSGTLVDAISYGLPVVCSDQCFAGDTVARLGLGPLFVAGDPQSLEAAIRSAPRSLDPDIIERARAETSAQRMAALHLDALGRRAPNSGPKYSHG